MIITNINSYQHINTTFHNNDPNMPLIIEKINLTVAYDNPELSKDIASETFDLNILCQ